MLPLCPLACLDLSQDEESIRSAVNLVVIEIGLIAGALTIAIAPSSEAGLVISRIAFRA